jgi:tetratricopeptide (TPR) repeat protein
MRRRPAWAWGFVAGAALAGALLAAAPPGAEEPNRRGWTLSRRGRYEEAIAAFREALRADPALPSAHLGLGVAYSGLGRHDDAVEALREAIRLRPAHAESHYNLGVALQRAGRLGEAAPALEKAVALKPDYAAAWSALGWTRARLGGYASAAKAYAEALRLRADDVEALRGLGTTYGNMERWADAVPALERAAKLQPAEAGVHYDLGRAYAKQGRAREAVAAFLQAVRLRPDFPAALFHLGLARIDLGQRAEAIDSFRRALRIDPTHAAARLNLERALLAAGDTAGATAARRELDPRAATAAADTTAAPAAFTDVTEASSITFRHESSPTASKYLIETMGGGVALFDYDGDGRLDVFFTNGAALSDPMPAGAEGDKSSPRFANRLYRNQGGGTFEDTTARAGVAGRGYGMGAAVGDYDNDGAPDLYVTNYGANILYHNDGDGTFTDVTERARVAAGGWSASAGFFDYDNDGRLDLFVTRYVDFTFANNPYCGERRPGYREYCHPRSFRGMTNLLFRNNGDGTFADVSAEAGIAVLVGKSLGLAFADYDGDGRTDVYVANDSVPAFLLRNEGHGRFADVALAAGVAYNEEGAAVAGMGADLADYDDDGRPDLFVTTLSGETYSLYRNRGEEGFAHETRASGVAQSTLPYSGWGTRFLDYDNDGRKDLFVAQGHVLDTIELTSDHLKYEQPPLLLKGHGDRFVSTGSGAGPAFGHPGAGRGAAFGDIDDDGDTDVVVASCGQRPHVLRNDAGHRRHWLAIRTVGTRSNRDGIGARVKTVSASGLTQYHTVTTAGSYLSASDARLLVGLGSDDRVRLVEVRWPSGEVQKLEDVKADQLLTVREPAR